MRTLLAIVALTGCTFPEKPGPPFGCVGDTLPSTAPDTIHVRGSVFDPVASMPVPGATETAFIIDSMPLQRFSVPTDAGGAFAADEITGGAPHPQFLNSHALGFADTNAYPATPVANNVDVAIIQFLQNGEVDEIDELAMAAQLSPLSTTETYMIVSVVDCNDNAVEGATISVTPMTADVHVTYFANGQPDRTATHTDEKIGSAFVTGVTEGAVTVTASFESIPFRSHDVTTKRDALTFTEVSP